MASTTSEPQFGAKHFDKIAKDYEENRDVMSKVIQDLIAVGPPITSESVILDNACGPGIVTGEILKKYAPKELHAADISSEMINILHKKDWPIKAEVMDAQDLTYPDGYFTHVYMNMGIFLLPDAEKGASEIYRVLKPGGTAVVTSIKRVGWVKLFQEAQQNAAVQKPLWKGPLKEEWYTEEKLRDVLLAGGFKDIKITNSETVQPGTMVEKFVKSMRETVTKSISEGWTEAEKERFETAADEVLKKELENPRDMEVLTYVAVVKK